MGYSEPRCQLCRASLTSGRLRAVGEAAYESWEEDFMDSRHGLYDSDLGETECDEDAGCELVVYLEGIESPLTLAWKQVYTDEGPPSTTDDLIQMLPPHLADRKIRDVEHVSGAGCKGIYGAYPGSGITAQELRGSHSFVCVMGKKPSWKAQADDVSFEIDGRFYISTLMNTMREREMGTGQPPMLDRHGCRQELEDVDDIPWDVEEPRSQYMPDLTHGPVHLSCMEIFCHASVRRFGYVHLAGLWDWRRKYCHNSNDRGMDMEGLWGDEVLSANEQWWLHVPGQEFLVANPCQVPGWPEFLRSCIANVSAPFDIYDNAIGPAHDHAVPSGEDDIFTRIPVSIRDHILHMLSPKDVASLRLASRTFRSLPQSLFRGFVRDEMPWVWESWASQEHLNEIKKFRDRTNPLTSRDPLAIRHVVSRVLDVLNGPPSLAENGDPEERGHEPPAPSKNPWHEYVCDHSGLWVSILDKHRDGTTEMTDLVPWALEHLWEAAGGKDDAIALPPSRTNWYDLYCGARRMARDRNGIKNRAYVWATMDRICEMIAKDSQEERAED